MYTAHDKGGEKVGVIHGVGLPCKQRKPMVRKIQRGHPTGEEGAERNKYVK
jgi:hypothetical protein